MVQKQGKKLLALTCAGIASLVMSQSSHANLLVDGNFDTYVASSAGDWVPFNGLAIGATTNALSAPNAASGSDSTFGTPGAFENFAAAPGQTFDLTGESKITSLTTGAGGSYIASVQFTFWSGPNGTGTNLGTVQTAPGSALLAPSPTVGQVGTYTLVNTGPGTAPAGTASGQAFVLIQAGNGDNITAFLDNLDLEPVPEPASLSLIGLPLLGMAMRRRRN